MQWPTYAGDKWAHLERTIRGFFKDDVEVIEQCVLPVVNATVTGNRHILQLPVQLLIGSDTVIERVLSVQLLEGQLIGPCADAGGFIAQAIYQGCYLFDRRNIQGSIIDAKSIGAIKAGQHVTQLAAFEAGGGVQVQRTGDPFEFGEFADIQTAYVEAGFATGSVAAGLEIQLQFTVLTESCQVDG